MTSRMVHSGPLENAIILQDEILAPEIETEWMQCVSIRINHADHESHGALDLELFRAPSDESQPRRSSEDAEASTEHLLAW